MEKQGNKTLGIGFWLIVAAGLFLRINAYIKNPSFWFDESALAYNVISLKYIDLFGIMHLQQVAPPLFLVLSKWFTTVFGVSDMNLRFFPFLFGCLSFIPFYYILKNIFEKTLTINFAMFLFAINPKLIYFGTEFKPYILDVFFSLLFFLIFTKIDLKHLSFKKIFLIGAVLGVSIWFSFTTSILCFVGLLTLLIAQKNEVKKWVLLCLPVVFNYALFAIYYMNVSTFYSKFMVNFFKNEFNHYTLPISYFFNNEFSLCIMITTFAIVTGIIYFMMDKKRLEIAFMMWSFVLTIILSHLHFYPAYQRFMLFLLPFVIIILAMVFNMLIDKKNVQSRLVLVIIIVSLLPTSVTVKGSEARELTEYFLKEVKSDDFIVVDNLALPDFLYYTYNTKMDNKIVVPFDKVKNRILYRQGFDFEFPQEYDKFCFYSTRTKGFDQLVKTDNGIKTIRGFKILNRMITPNGGIFFVLREKQ